MIPVWRWAVLGLLGAYHGLNPAMGWLFALALGLQEKCRSAVIAALLPIAAGHAAAIATAILLLDFVQHLVPIHRLKWPVAGVMVALGVFRLFRASHPRGAGMRVGGRDLFIWSFLMASAHGAGLMLIPVLWSGSAMAMHHAMSPSMSEPIGGGIETLSIRMVLLATLVHTAGVLIVSGVLAIIFFSFYEKFGLKLLRHTWFNFDRLWAVALLIAGVALLFY